MNKKKPLIKKLTSLTKPLVVVALFVVWSHANSLIAQNWDQIIKTVASDRGTDDYFGYSVAISGDYAIVGAYEEDEDATGGNTHTNAGSAYIFKNNEGTWSQLQKIVASDRGADDYFGYSVAISGDYAIVGAFKEDDDNTGGNNLTDAGSVYIFKNNAGTWSEVQKIVATDRGFLDYFGNSVAISGDYAIIGASAEDDDATGENALTDAGSAYLIKNNAGTWSQVQKIVASGRGAFYGFGYSVAISGDYATVGAYQDAEDATGGNTLYDAGSAYIFENNAGTWTEAQKIVAADRGAYDYFGASVAISGDYTVVGAYAEDDDVTGGNILSEAGSAYIFKNNAGTWSQVQKVVASDRGIEDYFGVSVSISEDYAIVGAFKEDDDNAGGNNLTDAGSAYIFKNNAGTWSEVQKMVASDRGIDDQFGVSVAISGDYAVAGAFQEDEDASGGNTITRAGSAYIFRNSSGAGIVENSFGKRLFVYPNPTNGNFSIDLGAVYENVQILIADISGKLIDSRNIGESQSLNLSIEGQAGIYVLSVQADNKKAVIRLVKE
ncbi:MAG: T9SS type A sorting domain-containing protein [Lentimicrobium sp.]